MTTSPWYSYRLPYILQQRRWQVCARPYLHFTAQDVFTPEFYSQLDSAYEEMLNHGLSEVHDSARFSRNIKNYDAYSLPFKEDMPEPLRVFLSREWHDMLSNLAGVRAVGDVNGGFHHHLRGSKTGSVHNDLNPGWFLDSSDPYAINLSRNDLCDYSSGRVSRTELKVRESVRALAVIFFLHNPPWHSGDGGETGMYTSVEQTVSAPTKVIPPINNSIFMFECRPNSFHSFLSNRNAPRNSMIMWLHRSKAEVVERWGEDAIVYWGDSPRSQPV